MNIEYANNIVLLLGLMVEINVLIDALVTTLERAMGFPMLFALYLMVIVNMVRLI